MKKETKNIINEIVQRKNFNESVYSVVGIEIRNQRLSLSRTLASLSYKICSTSYISKLENRKIAPNRKLLREICMKLNLEDKKISYLLNLKSELNECVKAYFHNDFDTIQKIFNNGYGFLNYRYKLIEFIYFIAQKKLIDAEELANDLGSLISSMSDDDLSVYTLFYGILRFYRRDFLESKEIILSLKRIKYSLDYVLMLKKRYIFYCNFMLNDGETTFSFYEFRNIMVEYGQVDTLDFTNYIMGIFLLRNNCLREYVVIYKAIHNKISRNSLSLYAKLLLNPSIKIKKEWLVDVYPFFYYLGLVKYDKEQAIKEISVLSPICYDLDFNYLLLQYLIIERDEDRYRYILTVVKGELSKTQDKYNFNYFLNELHRLAFKLGRYKDFARMYGVLGGEEW